jgi:hypothetical protein
MLVFAIAYAAPYPLVLADVLTLPALWLGVPLSTWLLVIAILWLAITIFISVGFMTHWVDELGVIVCFPVAIFLGAVFGVELLLYYGVRYLLQ